MLDTKEMNIYQKLQEARYIVLNGMGKKSGKNTYAGFEYFELKDFVPQAITAFRDLGITSIFNIEPATTEVPELATLKITDGKEEIVFKCPTADASTKGQLPIQSRGALITYMRRFMYQICLDIVDNDVVDALSEEQKKDAPKTTTKTYKAKPEDIELLKKLYNAEEQAKIIEYHKIKTLDDLDPVSAVQYIQKRGGVA